MVQLLLQEPLRVLVPLFSYNHFLFIFFLLFSFSGLPVLDPLLAAVSLPFFAIFALASSRVKGAVNLGDHHYYPVLPFFLVAAVNGTTVLTDWAERHIKVNPRRMAVALTAFALGMGLTAGFFWASGPLSWRFWNRRTQLTYAGNRYLVGEHTRLADEFVRMVPPKVPLLASDYLLAHLANRPQVYHFFRPPDDVLERVDYAVADLLQNHVRTKETMAREVALLDELLSGRDFALRAYEDGLLFFQRDGTDGYVSRVEVLAESPQPQMRLERDLGGRLRLLGYDLPAGPLRAGERCHVTYYWQVLDGFAAPFDIKLGINPESVETHRTDYVLADRFFGTAGEFSVLHLPTYIQMPPQAWQPAQVIRETYKFRLPADARGEYDWSVGLYAVPKSLGIQVSSERQVPGTEPIALGMVTVQP
jgi:hypothetical protein